MKEGDIVFEISKQCKFVDSVGDKFYIIIEGEVLVYVKDESKQAEADQVKSSKDARGSDISAIPIPPLKQVWRIGVGGSFGEQALLKNRP